MANDAAVKALKKGGEDWRRFLEGGQPLDFTEADLRDTDLSNRDFPKTASFDRACFNRTDLTSSTHFREGTNTFRHAKFHHFAQIRPEVSPTAILDFTEAEFFADVHIDARPSPHLKLIFNRTRFHGKVTISQGARHGRLDFSSAEFRGDVIVQGDNGELSFVGARFGTEQPVRAVFNGSTLHKGADFSHASFLGPAHFENVTFGSSSSFAECAFFVAPNFHNATLHQGTMFSPQDQFPRLFRDTESPGAANAYRTLKLAMNAQHAHSEELGFFLLEMRSSEPYQKPWVRPLYRIYDFVSLYGLSVSRPLVIFAAFNIAVGLIYSGLAGRGWWAWDSELLALTLYGAIPFAPALRWEQVSGANGDLFPPGVQPIVPVVVAAQGIVSTTLLFLVLLGLRNMFKIK